VEIRGTVAVVTGAAVGLGRAIARRLAAEGAAVVLADVDADGVEQTRRMVEAEGGRAEPVVADLRSAAGVAAAIDAATAGFGRLDVLVNNAGGGGHVPPHFPGPPRRSGARCWT
jgi:NAD(P)-dependent dehydrogenase (short-subunit alcohol dehydrogenase family)